MKPRGFTLIEMVAVLAIVALLALSAQPLQELALRRTQELALRKALRDIRGALDEHRKAVLAKQVAPSAEGSPYPGSLRALMDGVPVLDADGKPSDKQRLYLLRRLPRDPLGDPAVAAEDSWGLRASNTPPEAPAPGSDVFDVYSRSEARALDGTRYREW